MSPDSRNMSLGGGDMTHGSSRPGTCVLTLDQLKTLPGKTVTLRDGRQCVVHDCMVKDVGAGYRSAGSIPHTSSVGIVFANIHADASEHDADIVSLENESCVAEHLRAAKTELALAVEQLKHESCFNDHGLAYLINELNSIISSILKENES